MLKNRNNFPPGGFAYFQSETGWSAPPHRDFNSTVDSIIQHRLANPRHNLQTARNVVEWELEKFTVERLKSIPGGGQFLQAQTVQAPTFHKPPLQSSPKAVVGAIEKVKKLKAGIGLLIDWLGSTAKPVPHQLATDRAVICLNCPENHSKDWSAVFTQSVSERLHQQLEVKNEMELRTEHDNKLGVCNICLCPMKLKIWTPTEFIKEHTSEQTKQDLPEYCWVKKEISL